MQANQEHPHWKYQQSPGKESDAEEQKQCQYNAKKCHPAWSVFNGPVAWLIYSSCDYA